MQDFQFLAEKTQRLQHGISLAVMPHIQLSF
jgi:hypothetical protein